MVHSWAQSFDGYPTEKSLEKAWKINTCRALLKKVLGIIGKVSSESSANNYIDGFTQSALREDDGGDEPRRVEQEGKG